MGCRSSKNKKVLEPQRKHAISERVELSELRKLGAVEKSGTVVENENGENGENDQKVTPNKQPSIKISSYEEPEQQIGDTGNKQTLQENGTTTNKQTLREKGKTTNKQAFREKGITTNKQTLRENGKTTDKQTPREKGKTTDKQTLREKGKTTDKQAFRENGKTTDKQTLREKGKTTNKQTLREIGIPTNKQTIEENDIRRNKQTVEEDQTTESTQTPLERFQEHELAIERVRQALTRYFSASGVSGSEAVSSEILTCFPDCTIQPAARLDRLVCQSGRIPAADFVTYVVTCETSPDNARNVVYVFHIFARRGEYRTAEGAVLAGEYLSAPYMLDDGRSGEAIQCKCVRINSKDVRALSEDKLPELFSLRGEANTEAFKWTEEMVEQDFRVRKLGAREGSWNFSAFDGTAIVV